MEGNGTYRLIVRRGPQPNQTFDLDKDIVTLGRDITNDIVINDPEVSRHHLRLTRGASGFNLEDLGSTNGTFIAGQRLTGVRPLNNGDMISLGETVTLQYELARSAAGVDQTVPGPTAQPPNYEQPQEPAAPQQQQPAYPPQQQNMEYTPPPQAPGQYGFAPQPQPDYQAQQEYDAQGYGYATPQVPPGYDYDPYAMREEEPRSTFRWIMIGCAILSVFCCCSSIIGLVIIDALNLWYDLPIVSELAPLFEDIANALGLV